ncbi:MAG: TetR/AcrR family transcriptional regulator [Spirochaetales bacterium]|nr:TetR/AcrR family transcriptional regulator [Spirochaetales bacterium]
MKQKRNTREEILDVALSLFSTKGYDATSLSDISAMLGVSKAALFKHFDSKEEILFSVMKMMDEEDRNRARDMNVPEDKKSESEEDYRDINKNDFISYALSQFEYWTENKRASEYRKFLSLERLRREELRVKWEENFVSGPLSYTKDVMEALGIDGYEKKAMRLWSLMFLSYFLFDSGEDKEKLKTNLKEEFETLLEK